jgi:opacity protein-like surface antigen
MKHILLLAVMLVLAFGSSAAPTETSTARVSGVSANVVEIEGVEFKGQKALLKAGYEFQRESRSSVVVLKTSNVARIQTGILTCTGLKRGCRVDIYRERAACSNDCYFVGYRGGVRAQ